MEKKKMDDLNSILLEGIVLKKLEKNSFLLESTRYQKTGNDVKKVVIVVSITVAGKSAVNYFEILTLGKKVRIVGHLTSEGITAEYVEPVPAF